MARLAIAWLLRRKFVSSVIVGVRTKDQLAANLEPGDWDMPEEAWKTWKRAPGRRGIPDLVQQNGLRALLRRRRLPRRAMPSWS